jgi:hypothetical protein
MSLEIRYEGTGSVGLPSSVKNIYALLSYDIVSLKY